MVKKPSACPECGAFIRLGWTENCGACGADLVFVENRPVKINTFGLSRRKKIVEWALRPRNVIGIVVLSVIATCTLMFTYAWAVIEEPGSIKADGVGWPTADRFTGVTTTTPLAPEWADEDDAPAADQADSE